MGAHESTHLFGHGERNQEIISRQQLFQLCVHPLQGFGGLTRRAVAVAASAVNIMRFAAFFTFIHGKTMNWRAATYNGICRLAMHIRHVGAEFFQIGRPVSDKNILYGAHVKTLS